ncbi:uncharacterized protein METZ01_LOCUS464693 [marine metagenome]|uniref:Uncharacterized protein n=1 Tax=marine metagenome TaxID=408172 RepID=A0A383AWC0_9ZZZZ
MGKARLGPRTAQTALGQCASSEILERRLPIDAFVVWPTAPPEFDPPPDTPREHAGGDKRQCIKDNLGSFT